MPDKQLLRLLGEDKRYIYRAVVWMLTGSLCSIGFTACLCYGLHLLLIDAKTSLYLLPFVLGAVCAAVRFLATIRAASVRDRLGRSVKKSLRAQLYAKLLRDGYIISQQDGDDRRKQRIYLTDKALNFLAENKVGSSESVKEIFSVVSDNDMEILIDVMAKLTDHLSKVHQ